jgi:hypothetical protein
MCDAEVQGLLVLNTDHELTTVFLTTAGDSTYCMSGSTPRPAGSSTPPQAPHLAMKR